MKAPPLYLSCFLAAALAAAMLLSGCGRTSFPSTHLPADTRVGSTIEVVEPVIHHHVKLRVSAISDDRTQFATSAPFGDEDWSPVSSFPSITLVAR